MSKPAAKRLLDIIKKKRLKNKFIKFLPVGKSGTIKKALSGGAGGSESLHVAGHTFILTFKDKPYMGMANGYGVKKLNILIQAKFVCQERLISLELEYEFCFNLYSTKIFSCYPLSFSFSSHKIGKLLRYSLIFFCECIVRSWNLFCHSHNKTVQGVPK